MWSTSRWQPCRSTASDPGKRRSRRSWSPCSRNSSGPAIVMVLQAPDAIKKWRTLMGATDPAKADAGTLRKQFAESIERNATHGSDAPETAAYEIGYFFPGIGLV